MERESCPQQGNLSIVEKKQKRIWQMNKIIVVDAEKVLQTSETTVNYQHIVVITLYQKFFEK